MSRIVIRIHLAILFLLAFPVFAQSDLVTQQAPAPESPWLKILFTVLSAGIGLAAPAIAWAGAKLAQKLQAEATAVTATSAHRTFFSALAALDQLALSVVSHLNASVKDKLQTALADGVLTDVEKADLKSAAMLTLKTQAGPELLAFLQGQLGALFDVAVSGAIEKAVDVAKILPAQATQQAALTATTTRPAVPAPDSAASTGGPLGTLTSPRTP